MERHCHPERSEAKSRDLAGCVLRIDPETTPRTTGSLPGPSSERGAGDPSALPLRGVGRDDSSPGLGSILLITMILAFTLSALASAQEPPSPIEFLQAMSRSGLQQAGAEKLDMLGPDGKIVYWAAGEGPVVVLVHGTNDQAGLWFRTVAALKDRYRVVAPDMPGHGESDPESGPLDMEMMTNAVEAIVDHVSPGDPVILVGNSMGGWASLLYVLDNPDRVSRLVLEDSGGISLEKPPKITLVPTTRDEARDAFDAAIGPNGTVPDAVLDDFVKRAPTSPAARFEETSWKPYLLDGRLGEIEVPTTLIWGEADEILPLSYGERMKSMIPGATIVTIPGCGHIPHNECSDEFLKALGTALARSE